MTLLRRAEARLFQTAALEQGPRPCVPPPAHGALFIFCSQSPITNHQLKPSPVERLTELFEQWSGEKIIRAVPLPPSGSRREYFRLKSTNRTAIGAYNPHKKENRAFIHFTRHFLKKGIPVPRIYKTDQRNDVYIVEDLGDSTLFSYLAECRKAGHFPTPVYKHVVEALAHLQIEGGRGLDYSLCYPRAKFDRQSMLWDMSYFKHFFLKLGHITYDEQALEDDFNTFADYLMQAETDYFLFRDFQSRNIMLYKGGPYFIDYQGGRQGALQYDLASLLFQAKANLAPELREELLHHYLAAAGRLTAIEPKTFINHYYGYVLVRTIQVLGAYGFRGFYERKDHFLESIPFAIKNTEWLLEHVRFPVSLPALTGVLEAIVENKTLKEIAPKTFENGQSLTVAVRSFSYKRGIPEDPSDHGGGFVFDCRALNNPGRYPAYQHLTGRDEDVITFFNKQSQIDAFLRRVYALVDPSIERYLERGFTHLMVSFGCTGGQHRSVFCADSLAEHLRSKYNVKVELAHIEQELKGWQN